MADKLDIALLKIKQMLLVVFDQGASDGERLNPINAVRRCLAGADSDCHEMVERILSAEDMQRILDHGREQGRIEVIEQRRQAMAAVGAPSPFANGEVGEGVNGFTWREIVGHCVANRQRIRNAWESNFIESVAEQLAGSYYNKPTEKQVPIVRRIFMHWFGGQI